METRTPKHEAIEKFLGHEDGLFQNWIVRAVDAPDDAVILLQAFRDDQPMEDPQHTLELHSRQIRLQDDELDEATKTMIRRWLASL